MKRWLCVILILLQLPIQCMAVVNEQDSKILFYENFEGEVPRGMSVYPIDNIAQIEKDENGGYLKVQRVVGNTRSFYYNINYNEKGTFYPSVVMEMDIRIMSSSTVQAFVFRDVDGGYSINGSISGSAFVLGGKTVADLGFKSWNKVSVVSDFANKCFSVYINGDLKAENLHFANSLVGPPEHVRFTVPSSAPADYMIDNVLFYEGSAPRSFSDEELEAVFGGVAGTSVLDNIFSFDAKIPGILKGYTTVHTKSGIVYRDGAKSILENIPFKRDGIAMVPLREISGKFGFDVTYDSENQSASVGDSIIYINSDYGLNASGKFYLGMCPEVVDGCIYVPLESFVENVLGKKLFYDETSQNGGMAVIGDDVFVPEEDRLQQLNDFTLFYRPKREEIKELFNTNNVLGEHPRILMRKNDVLALRERLKTDTQLQTWLERAKEVSKGNTRDIIAPALVYQLTGDISYARISYNNAMDSMVSGKWADIQYLSVGEGAHAVGIAYDWIYKALTPEERSTMEEALYEQSIGDVINWYKGTAGDTGKFITQNNNWNEICNGGIAIAALAMFDVYPELCAELMEYFLRDIELPLSHGFSPDGASVESPSYYQYGKMYLYSFFQALESVLGTEFNMMELVGFERTLSFIANMHTQSGKIFGFGDYSPYKGKDRCIDPSYLWVAAKKDKKDEAALIYHYLANLDAYKYPSGVELVNLMLNYEPWMESYDFKLPLDNFFGKAEIGVMRQSYTDPNSAYVGFKGCLAEIYPPSHKHMDSGMFIFESMGEMWALDMGADSYSVYSGTDLPSVWDMKLGRWYALRNRASGHNTVVINPAENYPVDHDPAETSKIIRSESGKMGAIGIIDMSMVLKKDAQSAKRGFFFTDDRQSLVVRDEITLKDVSDVYWLMYTGAEQIEKVNDNTAILCKNGKRMRFEFISNADAELVFEAAEPLEGTPGFYPNENRNEGISRIALKINTGGELNITVKMTPEHIVGSDIEYYDKSVDAWSAEPLPSTYFEEDFNGETSAMQFTMWSPDMANVTETFEGGIGGKDIDDKADIIKSEGKANRQTKSIGWDWTQSEFKNVKSGVTFEMQLYRSNENFTFSKPYYYMTGESSENTYIPSVEILPGRWVKAAFHFDPDTDKVTVYENGVQIYESALADFDVAYRMFYNVNFAGSVENPLPWVAGFDNFRYSFGTYDPSADIVNLNAKEGADLTLKGDEIILGSVMTKDEFLNSLSFDDATAKIFDSSEFTSTSKADAQNVVDEGQWLLLYSANGEVIKYYEIAVELGAKFTTYFEENFNAESPAMSFKMWSDDRANISESYEGGIGGKDVADKADIIRSEGKTNRKQKSIGWDWEQTEYKTNKSSVTFEMQLYRSNENLIFSKPYYYMTGESSEDKYIPFVTILPGRWVKAAFHFDPDTNMVTVYENGILIYESALADFDMAYRMFYNVNFTGSEDNPRPWVAGFDNFRYSFGPYDPSADIVNISAEEGSGATVNGDKIFIPYAMSKDAFLSSLSYGDAIAKIFDDSKFLSTTAADSINRVDEGQWLLLYSSNGEVIRYFEICRKVHFSPIEILENETEITASVSVEVNNNVDFDYESITLFLAAYSGNELVGIDMNTNESVMSGSAVLKTKILKKSNNGITDVKAFVWYDNIIPAVIN